MAHNLDALYEYMCMRLMQANASNKPEWLDEVSRLLNEIRAAWLQLPAQGRAQVAQRHDAAGARNSARAPAADRGTRHDTRR